MLRSSLICLLISSCIPVLLIPALKPSLPARGQPLLLQPVLFILHLPPVLRNRLVAVRLLDAAAKRRLARVQLVPFALLRRLHRPVRHGHVAAEALPHVDQAALALAVALLELLALCREGRGEGLAEAVGGLVAVDHDAV